MKAMICAFAVAILFAAGADYILNNRYQKTADVRFVGAGTQLRGNEAGTNLVGKDWSGLNRPSSTH